MKVKERIAGLDINRNKKIAAANKMIIDYFFY